ncbi:hypothetical protein GCM10023172_41930 [Hymenobacter ginsengisoli]|uniref:TonB-dependent receptor plug domain-containing protein n=1 Tax=Hymenobacter ginsengisoli TaxID=1051626 RepID=A0ABP8QT36_9BACT|nr:MULTISPECIES: MG2 domain-containing protein [unclassified Hymenobacter]MBO2032165.1 TonB-dependent receptor plug domain-containing protein [Hymenobacter sp. BT559]
MPASVRQSRLKPIFVCFLLLGLGAFTFPTAEDPFLQIIKRVGVFYATALPEKAYLHLDRSLYAAGETIWFKGYAVEADSHRPDTLSKVLYVDLLSPRRQLVAQRTLRLTGGLAHGDIALPDSLPTGTYQVRAYTNWMRNAGPAFFFTRPLAIVSPTGKQAVATSSSPVDIRFFPEGGNLVEGLESEVGFKATDARGHGVAVQGTIVDARNQVLASFKSRHLGMGSFRLTPAVGQQYRALVMLPGGLTTTVALPGSQPGGYVLHASETDADFFITIRRRLGAGVPPSPALLLAQVRGTVVFASRVPLNDAAPVAVKLPKAKFPPGLAHLTLFDEQSTAQCERLLFTPNPPGVRLALLPDKPAYGPREAVHIRLTATDAAGQPVAGHFSVAVAAQAPGPDYGPTIVSHLLLSSDLAGVIEDPGYYFREPANPETQLALNDLLLTQGWRRFVWKELLAGQLPERRFALEQGLSVSGQVFTAANQPAAARPISYLQTSPRREAQTVTDATGHFLFRGLDGLDTTAVVLRAQPAKGEKELSIRLLAPPPGEVQPPDALLASALPAYLRRSQQRLPLGSQASPTEPIKLGGVNVRGYRSTGPTDGAVRTYANPNVVVIPIAGQVQQGDTRNIFQYLQGRMAGVAVTGNHMNIRQASTMQDQSTGKFKLIEPLYLIDGSPVSAELFASFPISDIQSVDIMNQNSGAIFGLNAYGGVVAAYSRRNGTLPEQGSADVLPVARSGMQMVKVPGYYQAREFYAPRYSAATASSLPDPRYATLYWAPELQTDAKGQAQLSFFTSDAGGTFQAVAEGLSPQGLPLQGSATLLVKAPATK